MFWTILALGMTVLMGGIIAYNGDVIGRKYGKKRLTLFGMRPKHTAILITSVTGVLISASTTAAIFLLTPPVRHVILQGERAIRENSSLQASNKNLETRSNQLASQKARLQSEMRQEQAKVLEARRRRETAERQQLLAERKQREAEAGLREAVHLRDRAIADRDMAFKDRKKAIEETRQLRAERDMLKNSNRQLAESNVSLAEKNTSLAIRNKELSDEVDLKIEDNRRYNEENAKIASQNEELVRENGRLAREQELLRKINGDLYAGATELEDKNRNLATRNRELTEENQKLVADSNSLKRAAAMSVTALYTTLEALRTRPVAVHTGEDLARITIPARSTPAQVRELLKQLTREASDAAKAKGADPGERATTLAVQIVDKRTLADTPFGVREVSISEDEQINQIISATSNSDLPVCVLAMAAGNSVKGEPAIIDLQPLADRLVYPRGRIVASKKFNASSPPEIVFMDLVQFLKDVGRNALERGMIPRVDPATGEPQVGALDWPELVRLVERVRGAGRNVQVSALAAGDTSASGPLKLEFRVDGTY